ncbi:MAG: ribosome-associated translation inhibitor RaiA [Actinomycetaceae bacterium]|nr:ribosome-associated translation inhibitor RaiA [Actinomycetaceae bacterium]
MDIIINARNAEIHPNFREYVEEKVAKVEQFYPRARRVAVELNHERNPRQADTAERIELTVYGKGPVIRAEASSSDRYAAVDIAAGKLFERLRRARDRAKDHHRLHAEVEGQPLDIDALKSDLRNDAKPVEKEKPALKIGEAREEQLGDSPVIVREKLHEADRMSVSDALYQMELVGHPFFLFIDSQTDQPCVVYHRHGWTYGVLRLNIEVK